jgi:hypothetical protein
VAAAAIWLDPARAALGYDQVDIVLAAGFKLTPAIFAAREPARSIAGERTWARAPLA